MKEKNRKIEVHFFTICEWQKEQDFLREQHKAGWKFIKVSCLGCYYFEKCEPEDVIYQLDYNQGGTSQETEYIQMFRDCGWEYIQETLGYSYFRKPASAMHGQEEIFCDNSSRIDMMKRVFKGRIVPLITIFFCIILPQLFFQSHLGGTLSDTLTISFAALGIVYLINFLWFGYQFWSYWKSLHQ